jgi:hypothetical protein
MGVVGLVACVCNGCARWHDRSVRLCTGLIAIALAAFFLERTGAGVWTNAQFDLVIAVAIGLGWRTHKFLCGHWRAVSASRSSGDSVASGMRAAAGAKRTRAYPAAS